MANIMININRKSFIYRIVIPVGTALGIWVVLTLASYHLGWIENPLVYRMTMNVVHLLLFFFIIFASIPVYSLMFFRGASFLERAIGSYIIVLAFVVKEMVRVSEYFSIGESLYYGLSPYPFLHLLFGQMCLLSIAEMVCRYLYKNNHRVQIRIVTTPIATVLAVGLCVYILLNWSWTEDAFWIYDGFYKSLFK